MEKSMLRQTSEWAANLDDESFRQLRRLVEDEQRKRHPPKVSPDVQRLIALLRVKPVGLVAKETGRSRQRLYRICNKHGIDPVPRGRNKKPAQV